MTVTFGWFSNYMFWRDSRGKRYPMCDADADQTVGYLREHP